MDKGHRKTTEEEKHYYCKEFIPVIAGTCSGTLACFGGGKSMWEDYAKFKELNGDLPYDTMATNVAAMFIPKLTHIFSLHYKHITFIARWRMSEYGENDRTGRPLVHAARQFENTVDHAWFPAGWASTSGFMMLVVGYLLGYRKFVLIGIPMDGSGYFYKPTINETFGDKQREEEIYKIQKKFPEVRSMSGRTRDIMGEPSLEWLKGEQYASTI